MFYKHLARLIFPLLLVMATLSLSTASFADSDNVSSANVKVNSALVNRTSSLWLLGITMIGIVVGLVIRRRRA